MNSIDSNLITARGEFRDKVRAYCKRAGIKQASVARAIGFTPTRFSERLNGTNNASFFNLPEVKAIVGYLDSQYAFYDDTEGLDLLHRVYPPKAAPAAPVIASQGQATQETAKHAQSEQLVFTATTTTTITTTITATTTFTAGKLALSQPELSGPLDHASSDHLQAGGNSQEQPARLLNEVNSDQERALAKELARLVLEYLSRDNSTSKGGQEIVNIDVASQAEDSRSWLRE